MLRRLTAALALLLALPARAHFGQVHTTEIPVDRLLQNVTSLVTKHPNDPWAHYTLGRLNYLAFARNAETIPVIGREHGGFPGVDRNPNVTTRENPREDRDQIRLINHALTQLHIAADKHPLPLFFLTLGSALEDGGAYATLFEHTNGLPPGHPPEKEPADAQSVLSGVVATEALSAGRARQKMLAAPCAYAGPALRRWQTVEHTSFDATRLADVLATCWKDDAIVAYHQAFLLSTSPGVRPSDWSSQAIEAGEAYVRLVTIRDVRPGEKNDLDAAITFLRGKTEPPPPVTPIVFALDQPRPLATLTSGRTVHFDLDGMARGAAWTWLQPITGVLVWDPQRTGHITSGRQLFGSVTFWMFWRNGYEVLQALDDNGDGELSGAELHGLAVWFDRNGNGVSDPGEVVPVEELGIAAIATESTGQEDGALMNLRGLRLTNGRVLPTYDWVSQSVVEVSAVIPSPPPAGVPLSFPR